MTAAWTAPITWQTNDLVTAALMNTHLRDNLEFLRTPPFASYLLAETSDYQTNSSTFVDIDATKLALTITTGGGPVLIGFYGSFYHNTAGGLIHLDVAIDGTRVGGDDGAMVMAINTNAVPASFILWKSGLSAASHTFKLQWNRGSSGTATLYSGTGAASGYKTHPQFWVREVS